MPALGTLLCIGTHRFCHLISLHEMLLTPQEQVSLFGVGQIPVAGPEPHI